MTTGFFRITTVALAAALSACAASAPPLRVATAQTQASQLLGGPVRASPDCSYDSGSFDAPDAMKLPQGAFSSCWPQQ
jgi:hypothetical protein